jgi:hypothetical protein
LAFAFTGVSWGLPLVSRAGASLTDVTVSETTAGSDSLAPSPAMKLKESAPWKFAAGV